MRKPPRRVVVDRTLWSLLAVGAFTSAVAWTLASRVPDILDGPLAAPQPASQGFAVRLLETAGPPPPVYVMVLRAENPSALLRHPELRFRFATYGARVRFTSASVEFTGTNCSYQTPPAARLVNDELLPFERQPACDALQGEPAHELKLTVRLARRDPIALWTYRVSETESNADLIHVADRMPASARGAAVRGRYIDYLDGPGARRVDLLGYVWQVGTTGRWIWWVISLAALLALAGALLLPRSVQGIGRRSPRSVVVATVVSTFCLAAALGLLYAVLVPPFQAPDEPDHFLSYARLTGDGSLPAEAAEWARLGHLERIRFNGAEQFRPVNVGRPFPTAWNSQIAAENVMGRSSTTVLWWTGLTRFIRQVPAPLKLLLVRFANVGLFAFAAAAGALLLLLIADIEVPYPQLLPVFVFLIPTLPFFAMHMSEYALLTSAYVFLAACLLALFVDGPRSAWVGLPLGTVIAVMVGSGRSAVPMLPLVMSALAARILLGSRGVNSRAGELRAGALFWIGLALGLSSMALIAGAEFAVDLRAAVEAAAPQRFARGLDWTLDHPMALLGLGLAGFPLELGVARIPGRVSRDRASATCGPVVRWVSFGCAGAIAASFAVSLATSYPHLLDNLELRNQPRPLPIEYVANVLRVAASSFRIGDHDLQMSVSFWAGFGWIDTIPGSPFVDLCVVGAGLALIVLLMQLGIRQDVRRFTWLATLGLGLLATLAVYALAAHLRYRNLHGRYLIGAYLSLLAVFFSAPALAGPVSAKWALVSRPALLLTAAGVIHTYCLWFILNRYF